MSGFRLSRDSKLGFWILAIALAIFATVGAQLKSDRPRSAGHQADGAHAAREQRSPTPTAGRPATSDQAHYRGTGLFRIGDREYYLHESYSDDTPRPLVIVLHGWRNSPADMQRQSNYSQYSSSHGFVVAYGVGVNHSWNAGTCCGGNQQGDVAYLVKLVADVEQRVPINPQAVYLVGFSNGGMLALQALCRRPDLFAAAGVMSATLTEPCQGSQSAAARPLRVLQINGMKDSIVPYFGGYSSYTNTTFLSSQDEASRFPTGTIFKEIQLGDLGHTWATKSNSGLDATDVIWKFLRLYRTPPSHDHR